MHITVPSAELRPILKIKYYLSFSKHFFSFYYALGKKIAIEYTKVKRNAKLLRVSCVSIFLIKHVRFIIPYLIFTTIKK